MGNEHSSSRCRQCHGNHPEGKCLMVPSKQVKSVVCFKCGISGHFAKDCDMVFVSNRPPPSKVCVHCGGRHASSECRENLRRIVVEEQDKAELKKKVEVLEAEIKSMKVAEEVMKKKIEEVSPKSDESSPKKGNTEVINSQFNKPSSPQIHNDVETKQNLGNVTNQVPPFPVPPRQYGPPPPPPQLPPSLLPSQQFSGNLPAQPIHFPSNQSQWDSNKNQSIPNTFSYQNSIPPMRPPLNPPFMYTNQPPPLFNQNPQQYQPNNQYQSPPNQQQYNKPFHAYQEQSNQNLNRPQNANQRGRGRGNMNRGGYRGGRGYSNNNQNTGNSRGYQSDSGRGRQGGNRGRALFSGEERKTSRSDNNSEESNTDIGKQGQGSKNNASDDTNYRQKKDHQGVNHRVCKGRIHKDKQIRSRGACNKQGPNRKDTDSNGDSDSTSTGYETALNDDSKKNKVRRNRRKKETSNSNLSEIKSTAELKTDNQEDSSKDIPLSKSNLGKGDILMKYIGNKLPTLADAVYDEVSLYQKVEGIMLLSDPASNEPTMEVAKNLLHIIEFKSKYPNAKSFFIESKN